MGLEFLLHNSVPHTFGLFHYHVSWSDYFLFACQVYHESRKIVGAIMQHITYAHWLPMILGPKGMMMMGQYEGYDPTVNPTIVNEFATAAMRFGHSLIQPILFRLNETFQPIPEGNLPLHRAFFAPYRLLEEGGIDPFLRGLFAAPAKKRMPGEFLNTELTEKLFVMANAIGQDLASLNVQRSRDHGLQFYNDYRPLCGLPRANTFEDLRNEIHHRDTRSKLEALYGHPGGSTYQVLFFPLYNPISTHPCSCF